MTFGIDNDVLFALIFGPLSVIVLIVGCYMAATHSDLKAGDE